MTLSGMTPAEGWRLLEPEKEAIQEGDEIAGWYVYDQEILLEWTVANPAYFGVLADHYAPVRRRLDPDPLTPLREELREASELLEEYMDAADETTIPRHLDNQAREWLKRNREIARNAAFGPGGEG